MVIVNPETKGPVGDSHLGEVGTVFTFALKSQQWKTVGLTLTTSVKPWLWLFPHGEFSSSKRVLVCLRKARD